MITEQNNPHTIDDFKMAITEYVRNVDCAILNMVLKNTVWRVNKCLETGGGHFEHHLQLFILLSSGAQRLFDQPVLSKGGNYCLYVYL